MLTLTERNYDIYERELLAIMKTLAHWRQYLIWTPEPFIILTDHANLLYWKSPQKLNQRTARWHSELQDYDFKIIHVPGSTHVAADALSRPPGVEQGKEDNQNITMIPQATFIRLANMDAAYGLQDQIVHTQNQYATYMDAWDGKMTLNKTPLPSGSGYKWTHPETNQLIIPPNKTIHRAILHEWHDKESGGHPGQEETIQKITTHYHWPTARAWITAYIKGCAVCQQMKNLTHRTKIPLY